MFTAINPASVFKPDFYSQGLAVTGGQKMLFISGQVGVAANGSVAADVGGQTRQALANLQAVLAEAGMSKDNIARFTIYLTSAEAIGEFSAAAGEALPALLPAATLLVVASLASPALLVEIEAIAVA